MAEMLVFVR